MDDQAASALFFCCAQERGWRENGVSKEEMGLAEIRRQCIWNVRQSTFDTLDTERKKHGRHARQRDRGLAPLLFRKA